jgi:hypothetical protein
MANFYSVAQQDMAQGNLDLSITGTTLHVRVILDTEAVVFGEADATMAAVMANDGAPLTASAEADVALTGKVVLLATNGYNAAAQKVVYTAPAAGETWADAIIYNADNDSSDATRIPVCHVPFITPVPTNGISDMEIRWSAVDGEGSYAISLNA